MRNLVTDSPITLTSDPSFWRSQPEVPMVVQDGFSGGEAVVQGGRWRGLIDGGKQHRFAWVEGGKLVASSLTTPRKFGQSLESDARGRALVLGGQGESIHAVEPPGAATCLGTLAEGKLGTACWVPGGGVAGTFGDDIVVYAPTQDGAGLQPRVRFAAPRRNLSGLRCLPSPDPAVVILGGFAFDDGFLVALGPNDEVRLLADFTGLDLGDIRACLDETGTRTLLPDGAAISTGGGLTKVEGLGPAIEALDRWPTIEPRGVAPTLTGGGEAQAAPSEPLPPPEAKPAADAAVAPSLARLGRLTAALIKMLRAAPARPSPDASLLALIRPSTPTDVRALIHAWAVHAPNNPTVYEFWMAPPKPDTRPFVRELAGECVGIGIFASGEPILARLAGGDETEVVMIDEEGQPYRYRGLEEFLSDLQMRAPSDSTFELDAWL